MCAKVHRHRYHEEVYFLGLLQFSNVRDKNEHMAKGLEENEGQAGKEHEHHAERVEVSLLDHRRIIDDFHYT